jgi:benzodiazapine receptor
MYILFLIIFLTLLINFLSMNKIDNWYKNLNKSSLTPPGYIFSIVWPILYILMSISLWLVWKKEQKITFPIILYFIQLILNFIWSPIFFKYHLINISLYIILLLWIVILIIICLFYKIDKLASILLIPYIIWLTFAIYLNFYIVINNNKKN